MFLFKVICVAFAALCCANAHVITPVGPHLHQVPFAAPHLDVHPLPAFHPAPLP
uniref:Uncharacterized protein n=1 Tax=Megaselia scalaris TaxID=36166 RepID=T1GN88_MEGSC